MAISIFAGPPIRHTVSYDTRTWLKRSKSAIRAGYPIEGAALLLKGIREFLKADLAYWDVRPKEFTPIEMAKALRAAGKAEGDSYAVLCAVIATAT